MVGAYKNYLDTHRVGSKTSLTIGKAIRLNDGQNSRVQLAIYVQSKKGSASVQVGD